MRRMHPHYFWGIKEKLLERARKYTKELKPELKNLKKLKEIIEQYLKGKEITIKTAMTKTEIVNKISENTGISKKEVAIVVESLMETVKESLLKREHISLRGFGNFIIKRRAEKTARNIQKNTTVIIPAHDYPSFKPAKEFVEKMKNN